MLEITYRIITKNFKCIRELKDHQILPSEFCENWEVFLYYRGLSIRSNEMINIKFAKNYFARNIKIKFETIVDRYITSKARLAMLSVNGIVPYYRAIIYIIDKTTIKDMNDLYINLEDIIIEENIGRLDKNQKLIYKKLNNDRYFKPETFVCSYSDYTKFENDVKYESLYKDE